MQQLFFCLQNRRIGTIDALDTINGLDTVFFFKYTYHRKSLSAN